MRDYRLYDSMCVTASTDEQIVHVTSSIGRPRQLYMGPTFRDYVDVENR